MSEYRSFNTGEILTPNEISKLNRDDKKRYDREQKVRSLMALIDNQATSEDERDTAMRMLSNLITRYQIDATLLRNQKKTGPAKVVSFEVHVSNQYNLGSVRAGAIFHSILVPLGGTSIKWWRASDSTARDTRIRVFISEDLVSFAKTLIASFTLQMETGMKVATVAHRRELRWSYITKSEEARLVKEFRQSYLYTWGATVGRRMAAGRETARKEAERETGTEIVLASDFDRAKSAQQAWHEAQYGSKTKLRNSRAIRVTEDGASAGRRDGQRAQLGINQIGGSRRSVTA